MPWPIPMLILQMKLVLLLIYMDYWAPFSDDPTFTAQNLRFETRHRLLN